MHRMFGLQSPFGAPQRDDLHPGLMDLADSAFVQLVHTGFVLLLPRNCFSFEVRDPSVSPLA